MIRIREYSVLVPITRDSDRKPHSPSKYIEFTDSLCDMFGGYTYAGMQYGVWVDKNGNECHDESKDYRFSTDDWYTATTIVGLVKDLFDQRAVYLRETSWRTEIL